MTQAVSGETVTPKQVKLTQKQDNWQYVTDKIGDTAVADIPYTGTVTVGFDTANNKVTFS